MVIPGEPACRASDCRLAESVVPQTRACPGCSGILPLHAGLDAFAARALLADAAEVSIDAQYYIWRNDLSGTMLFDALCRAADRGVRVRLLLDDNNTMGLDGTLAALASHPHVEVRLFNAFRQRRWRLLGFLTDFARLNRRMHNKSFTVDGQVTVVGGRNVGDEYLDASHEVSFVDLDVLAIGPVVADVAADFERYWNSAVVVAAESVLPPASGHALAAFVARAGDLARSAKADAYLAALARLPIVQDLLTRRLAFVWAPARVVSDDPAKGLARERTRDLVWRRLAEVLGEVRGELYLVSPYFVPTARGTGFFRDRARAGISVMVLTNSLEATDVIAVHAGYAKRRRALLRSGVRLFELRRTAPGRKRLLRMRGSFGGSSGSSLHSKTFTVDRTRVFVGSYNFDQRSARLNTEIGLIIESPELASAGAAEFAAQIPGVAYEVRLRGSKMEWIEQNDGGVRIHAREPGTTLWQRALVLLLSWLPIDWLL